MTYLQNEHIILTGNILKDNDARWTLVPDDSVQISRGMTANSQRPPDEREFEDTVHFMRRENFNRGCQESSETLAVTYTTMYDPKDGGYTSDDADEHQTITVGLRWN